MNGGGEYTPLASESREQPGAHYGAVPVRVARIGELPHGGQKLSRDGSVHVTDEVFNTASHFAGAMLAFLGGVELVTKASLQHAPWKIVSFSIYSLTLLALFTASTLHHGLEGPASLERALRMADYSAIYALIAGTFTPICLVFLHASGFGWALLGTLWFLACAGIAMTLIAFDHLPKWLPFTMFITMGWMGALLVKAIYPMVGLGGVALIAAGGAAYSAGGILYQAEWPQLVAGRFGFHECWHVAVLLGAGLHWCFMWSYVLPFQA